MTIEGLGKKFQDARVARGLTLDEAARLTKIRPSRLAEIEADDFSQFPSLAYAKGFLLIYGKFLDVDITPYLDVFETSQQVTVDGYSYLQDQPAPKPQRVRPRARAPVVRRHRTRDRSSPFPIIIAVGAIIVGFVLMRLILDIQRIKPQMVGVPEQTPTPSAPAAPIQSAPQVASQQAAPQVANQSQTQPPPASVAPAPSRSPVSVAETQPKKTAPAASVAPSVSMAPVAAATSPPAFANVKAAATASVAPKEPEVRRAEPVRAEDLARATASQTQTQAKAQSQTQTVAEGPNRIAIKPLKKTYIKVVVDNGSGQPAFERWISPSDGTVEFRGQKIAVRVLDRDAIQIKKNGKPVSEDDDDVSVE